MGKNEIIAVQTDFLYFPPPVLHSHNPTDYNIDSYSSPCSEKDDGVFYSDKWQKGAAKDAKLLGGIRLYDLVFILAKEECYNDTLPKLWDLSGFNNDTLNRFPQWNEVIAKNRQGRAWAWFWLLCRWTIFEKPRYGNIESINEIESYYFSDLKRIELLPLYNFENGLFKEVRETEEQSPEHYIKLYEFEKYLKNIDPIIPLPKLLFLETNEISKPEEHPDRHMREQINTGLYQKSNVFPCEPGTEWKDIEITIIDHDTVKIETPNDSGQFTYRELGMSFKKNANKSQKNWEILKLFARYNGRLDSEIPESAKRILLNDFNIDYYKKLPNYTKRLNKHLKELFGIKDSIFKYHYNKEKAYVTKIKFSDQRHIEKSDLGDPAIKSLHEIETEDIQYEHSIPDFKRFDA